MKPILFNTEMVRAILEGRKTVTRRLIKPRYRDDEAGFQVVTTMAGEFIRVEKIDEDECGIFPDGTERHVYPPYQPGDILWVRETWAKNACGGYFYRADKTPTVFSWRPSIHMPKEAARLFLRVTEVRVERLQDMNDDDVMMEGFRIGDPFDEFWDSTIKPTDRPLYGWDANPWVWVIAFERISKEDTIHG